MQVNGIRNNAIDGNFRSDFIYSIINFSNFVLLNIMIFICKSLYLVTLSRYGCSILLSLKRYLLFSIVFH